MMKIRLKERTEAVLSGLKIETTFKIPESSFIFMKVSVDGLTVRPKRSHSTGPTESIQEEPKPIRVLIPEGKTTVVCLSSGKVQFLNLNEKVQIVDLECVEIAKEKEVKECKEIKLVNVVVGENRRIDEVPSI